MKLFLLMAMTWAQEHGAEHVAEHAAEGHHEVVIPWGSVFVQAFNFGLLALILFILLRKAVKAHFAERAQSYKELVDRAENARLEAERNHTQMKERLSSLEASAQQSVSKARAEAEELRTRLMDEAKDLSRKMEQEAQRAASLELEKAKAHLRKELLEKALATSSEDLKKNLGTNEQKKLQNEFAEKIEVVGG